MGRDEELRGYGPNPSGSSHGGPQHPGGEHWPADAGRFPADWPDGPTPELPSDEQVRRQHEDAPDPAAEAWRDVGRSAARFRHVPAREWGCLAIGIGLVVLIAVVAVLLG